MKCKYILMANDSAIEEAKGILEFQVAPNTVISALPLILMQVNMH